jgi:outer membrane lipoprotein SlyB
MTHSNRLSFKFMLKAALLTATLCVLAPACSKKPVLYPNEHLKRVGREQADADIQKCMKMAEEYDVKTRQDEKVAKSTAGGAAGGAIAGAVGGAISGNVGGGIVTGVASGAAVGFFYGLFEASEPSAAYKSFVNKCLTEKGYKPVGWN